MADITQTLQKYILDIEQTIKDALTPAPPFLNGIISYHFGWVDQNFQPATFDSGKRLRPTLCLLVFEALTGGYKDALPAAASIEMIHNFTLLHDDIEDGDLERRGRPTAWTIWGKPLAINTGDFLYTLAFQCLSQLQSSRFEPRKIFAVQRLIYQACLDLTIGQDLDLRFEQLRDVTIEMYLDMIYKKTGALLEAAVRTGAMLGTSDEEVINNYGDFARNMGIAFQVRDDMLGIWGDSAKTGKSADNDLRRKKKTLPIIYMLSKAAGSRKEKLLALYAGAEVLTDTQIAFVRESLDWAGAYQFTQNAADTYIDNAFAALGKIDLSNQPQQDLERIAKFLIDRTH